MKRTLVLLLFLSLTTFVPLVFARFMDPELRSCMREVTDRQQQKIIDMWRDYHREYEDILEERRRAYEHMWDLEDDRDQRDARREAERRYSDRLREIRNEQRFRERDINRELIEEQSRCRDEERSRSAESRSRSFSSFRTTSSRTSFSRSSRTSYSRSSRTSSSFGQCRDIICEDGMRYPTCHPNGVPIRYFDDPCRPWSPPPPPPPPPPGQECRQCPAGYRCVCENPCRDPEDICIQICILRCERI